MKNPTKLIVLLLAAVGTLLFGVVPAQADVHQINLQAMHVGQGAGHRNYPELTNASQNVLRAKHQDTMRFHFPGQPHGTTITISSQVKIDRDSTGEPPYSYDGRAGFTVNPEDGVYEIKYDIAVENADEVFQVLDPIIIIDDDRSQN